MVAQPTLSDVMTKLNAMNVTLQQLSQQIAALTAASKPAPVTVTTSLDFSQATNSQFIPLT